MQKFFLFMSHPLNSKNLFRDNIAVREQKNSLPPARIFAVALKNIPQFQQTKERPKFVRENIPQAEAGRVVAEGDRARPREKNLFPRWGKRILVFEGKFGSFKNKIILVL